ncbi:hypothetical protein FRC12_003872 [Ceratobasidium sp. 428]|nr:hypothetical protein FRC12_003872 [Ceratobasidium sp. 428]
MIDFLRGELFAYCDLAFACMYHYMRKRGHIAIGMTYDVWCHWWINFLKSRAHNLPENLRLPENIDLIGAIPKWHLVGHDRECFICWALAFIQFVGCLDGEGPERVWAYLNEHSGSTSEQSPGQRTDSINNIAGDWNFEKAINMLKTLVARFRDAKKMQIREKKNFDRLTNILPATTITLWEAVRPEATYNKSTKAWESPFMDPVFKDMVICASNSTLLTKSSGGAQSNFLEERDQEAPTSHIANRRPGVSRCFLEGIELEHSIRNYNDDAKEIGKTPTPKQAEKLNSKRMALQGRIENFQKKLTSYMVNIQEPDAPRYQKLLDEDLEEDDLDLGMPSSYMPATLETAGLSTLAELERKLRRGFCNDAIESVRRLLGAKAAAINYKKAQIRGQVAVTRAESRIQAHAEKIEKARWRYLNSRSALIKPVMTEADTIEYQDLVPDDLQSLKSHFEDYATQRVGHSQTKLSWIWRSSAAAVTDDWEVDALRTEWFRAKEQYKRFDEQLVLVKREMILSIGSFRKHAELWEWRAANGCTAPGMQVYVIRRSRFFTELARRMLLASEESLHDDIASIQWIDQWLIANLPDEKHVSS